MNNNSSGCGDLVRRACKKIEHDSKYASSLSMAIVGPTSPIGATGPTGPTGPAGPATIAIGTTETGAPGTVASVINNGTTENAVLNFVIPQGPTGPTGATGPTGPTGAMGLQGPVGPAINLTVAATNTTGPGEDANVTINGTDEDYQLTFTIPQGPTGPNYGLNAYSGLYNGADSTIDVNSGSPVTVTLNNEMSTSNLTTDANGITIIEPGDYEITYSVIVTPTSTGSLTLAARNDEENIEGTSQTISVQTGQTYIYFNDIITTLETDDVITLQLTAQQQIQGNVNTANLVVKKLNN